MRAAFLACLIALIACGDAGADINPLDRPNGAIGGRQWIDDNPIASINTNGVQLPNNRVPVCGDSVIEVGETCDDGNTINGDGCSSTCRTETFSRNFVLNASTDSTPALPANTSAATSWGQCVATGSTPFLSCAKNLQTGGSYTVTAGISTVVATDPFGHIGIEDTTFNQFPALTTATDIGSVFSNTANTIVVAGYGTLRVNGSGSVQTAYDFVPTGSSVKGRGAGTESAPTWNGLYAASTSSASGGLEAGLGFHIVQWTGPIDQHLIADSMGQTATSALASMSYTSGGTFRFGNDGNAFQDELQGFLSYFQAYTSAVSLSTLEDAGRCYYGLCPDVANPIAFARSSTKWAIDGSNRAWPYAQNIPIVTNRGVEIHQGGEGTRAAGNGWVNDYALGNNLGAATAVGTPTLTTQAAAGPFAHLMKNITPGTAPTKECALVVDDDGANYEGYAGSIAPADNETTTGEYTNQVWASAGTSGVTTTKEVIGFVTNGTITPSLGTITVSGTSRNLGGCVVTTLAAGVPELDVCHVSITGSPTFIRPILLVGGAAADTGSIVACDAQSHYGYGVDPPQVDARSVNPDNLTIPASVVIPDGTVAQPHARVTVGYTLDHDLPTEAGVATDSAYVMSTSDGLTAEMKLVMIQVGAIGDGHSASDVLVRTGWRSALVRSSIPCGTGGTFGDNGTELTSQGTLGAIPAGSFLVETFQADYVQTIAGVDRDNEFIYLDVWPNKAACDAQTGGCMQPAKTLRASNTSGTMCAADNSDTFYTVVGARSSGTTVASANNHMQGAIAFTFVTN